MKIFPSKLFPVRWQFRRNVRILRGWEVTLTTQKEPSATEIPPQVFSINLYLTFNFDSQLPVRNLVPRVQQ